MIKYFYFYINKVLLVLIYFFKFIFNRCNSNNDKNPNAY